MKNLYSKCTDAELESYLAQFLHVHRALHKELLEADKHADRVNKRYHKALKLYDLVDEEWRKRNKP